MFMVHYGTKSVSGAGRSGAQAPLLPKSVLPVAGAAISRGHDLPLFVLHDTNSFTDAMLVLAHFARWDAGGAAVEREFLLLLGLVAFRLEAYDTGHGKSLKSAPL
eukprot:Skav226774  [mRNA]  locus=scaffold8:231566:232079:+ [translate_table: standard]